MGIEVPVVKTFRKSYNNRFYRNNNDTKRVSARDQVPTAYRLLVNELNYNSDIRRYCSLYIIKSLKASGEIPEDSKCFVKFMWNKFTISYGGLQKDYTYGEQAFIMGYAVANRAILTQGYSVLNDFTQSTMSKSLENIIDFNNVISECDKLLNLAENAEEDVTEIPSSGDNA